MKEMVRLHAKSLPLPCWSRRQRYPEHMTLSILSRFEKGVISAVVTGEGALLSGHDRICAMKIIALIDE